MREYTFYSITGINDWILEVWMVLLYCLDEIKTDEDLIYVPHERVIGVMKSWMDISLFQCSYIQFLFPEVCIVLLSKFLELPEKCSLICMDHSMSNLFEKFIGFYSRILQEISVYGSYLMCLAYLYWKIMVVFLYSLGNTISSINHGKERRWVSSMREIIQ